jgi:hypothetical protein
MKPSRGQVHRVCEESRRQSPSHQLHRFIGTLPPFAAPQNLPKNFLELLRELEGAADAREKCIAASGTRPSAMPT